MKVRYTPGENGLVGKTYKVEILAIEIREARHIDLPLLKQVKIKYEDGKTEWIDGFKLFNSVHNSQKIVYAITE